MVSIKIVIWQAPTRKAFQPSFQSQRDWLAKFRHDRWPLPLPLSSRVSVPSTKRSRFIHARRATSFNRTFQNHVIQQQALLLSPLAYPIRKEWMHRNAMKVEDSRRSLAEGRTHTYIYIYIKSLWSNGWRLPASRTIVI